MNLKMSQEYFFFSTQRLHATRNKKSSVRKPRSSPKKGVVSTSEAIIPAAIGPSSAATKCPYIFRRRRRSRKKKNSRGGRGEGQSRLTRASDGRKNSSGRHAGGGNNLAPGSFSLSLGFRFKEIWRRAAWFFVRTSLFSVALVFSGGNSFFDSF